MQITKLPDMFYTAKPAIFKKAKVLRENMTYAEKILWKRLNKNQLGVRFKSQHPIDIFIADFYCHQSKLVIEIDGDIHKSRIEYDAGRTADLEKFGITVLRFTNDEVLTDLDRVIGDIKSFIITTPN